jgi:hypothetical protein
MVTPIIAVKGYVAKTLEGGSGRGLLTRSSCAHKHLHLGGNLRKNIQASLWFFMASTTSNSALFRL